MSLMECPGCGKEISDKTGACIHCGAVIERLPESKRCPECGAIAEEGAALCGKCGYPFEKTTDAESEKKAAVGPHRESSGALVKALIAVIALVALLVASYLVYENIQAQNKEKQMAEARASYASKYEAVAYSMLEGAVTAEECGNLIKSVWYNTIFEEEDEETDKFTQIKGKFNEDFNTSIAALFADDDFSKKVAAVESNKAAVDSMMKDLRNPPDEWKEAYDELKEYYDAYADLIKMAVSPSGSLQTYSEDFRETDSEAAKCFDKVKQFFG